MLLRRERARGCDVKMVDRYIFLTFSSQTFAGPNECKTAIERYNTAVEEVSSTLRRYTRCISYSEGRDDCSREFSRIRAAHNEFGSAVADYERECT